MLNIQRYTFFARTCIHFTFSQLITTEYICLQLTLIEYFEANVGAAVVSGKKEIKEVAAAK